LGPGAQPLLGWLDHPSAAKGIHFAGEAENAWTFWGYDQLAVLCRRMASGLIDCGVAPGDVVTIVERSGPVFVATLFGTMLAGATPSPVAPPMVFQDPDRYERHVQGLIAAAKPALIVTDSDLQDRIAAISVPAGAAIGATVAAGAVMADGDGGTTRGPADFALVQFTSGSSGHARGVRVPFHALEANVAAIQHWLAMSEEDATATWLPVHHDMGLIGCLITPIVNRSGIWVLEPEHFIRSPERYLRCFGALGARLTAMPNFGLDYIARRVSPESINGLDFSEWRALIIGSERVDPASMDAFCRLLGTAGFARRTLLPAYGLAEATLAVTGLPLAEEPVAVGVDVASLVLGAPVRLVTGSGDAQKGDAQKVVGCGWPLADFTVVIVDESGGPLPEGHVGEIVTQGPSVTAGYLADAQEAPTSFTPQGLRTGDAGFLLDGQLFVLGRLGDSMKIRGRAVFAEDLETELVSAGLLRHRMAVLLGVHAGLPTAVAVVEEAAARWLTDAEDLLRRRVEGGRVVVLDAPRGTIEWTSSGKPKRRLLWTRFMARELPGELYGAGPESFPRRHQGGS
jgi:acyl-CoA synthetase (AMP-forming)/AMP-acid ligase II